MQATVGSKIVHIRRIDHTLTFDMTGKIRYQQENNNQRNWGRINYYLLMTFQ
jgi:hypothetical protein